MAVAEAAATPSNSLVDYVVGEIINQVRLGKMVPGQRLIASDLATAFNVSRAPVREALHVLSGEGVVRLLPNRGAIIAQLSAKELLDFLDFTRAVCALGIEQASRHMDNTENQTSVTTAFEVIEGAWRKRNADVFIDSLYQYHMIVNRISGNTFLDMFYSRPYFAFYNRLLADFIPGDSWDEYLEHYRHLTDVLLRGDVPNAAGEFKRHMGWASELLETNARVNQ